MSLDKHFFFGGLDSDSDHRAVVQGDYIFPTVNIRSGITDKGSNFAIENTKGNTLINFTLPTGKNTCIGARDFPDQSLIIYFLFNDLSNHSIMQYSWETGVITKIIEDPSLNFDINHKITGINLIDNLLFWTDRFTTPKKINKETAIAGGYNPFNIDYAEALKAPPLFPPTALYTTDTTKNANYLNGFLFQFKYRFYYDDFEKSAFSPISLVPLPSLDASTYTDTLKNNRIDISITTGSKIVRKIELAARIGNTGDFFSIAVINKADPYDVLLDNVPYTFLFYNDGVYNNVNLAESTKLYDYVPKLAKSQELIPETRITYGDIVEGFDPIDPVAALNLTVNPEAATKTFNITIPKIFIKSPFSTFNDQTTNPKLIAQPIYQFGSNVPAFGGFTPDPANITNWLVPYINGIYNQDIPLGGFVFYLAGTNFYGISRQNIVPGESQVNGVYQIPFNNNFTPSQIAINNCGLAINKALVYSSVTIPNVTEGVYVLRIASHNTTQAQLNSGDLQYQKRSTYTCQIAGISYYEVIISISATTATVNGISVPIVAGTINLPDCLIADLINANPGQYSSALAGYCIDHDTTIPSPATNTQLLAETRIDLAKVSIQSSTTTFPIQPVNLFNSGVTSGWFGNSPTMFTDHNGFFFFTGGYTTSTPNAYAKISNVQSGSIAGGFGPLYNLGGGLPNYTYNTGSTLNAVVSRTPSTGYFNNSRTIVNGNLSGGTGGIKGASVVIERGNWGATTVSGSFAIIMYAYTQLGSFRGGHIFYEINGVIIATFNPAFDTFNIGLGATTTPQTNFNSPYNQPTPYNYTYTLLTKNVVVTVIGKNATTANDKRGGWYQFGLVYYNKGNQSGVTNTNDYASTSTSFTGKTNLYGLKLYVPFYTETNPVNSQPYGGSQVTVDWSIYHKPPEWATHYQWVRTKNTANNRFIQFIAKSIVYVDSNNAVSNYTNGVKIRIDMTNVINDYKKIYPNSTLVYDWIKTPSDDRIRFIRDNNGNFFSQYMDVEVLGYENSQYLYVENKPGMADFTGMNGLLYEIYNPKLQLAQDEQLFWEIGECFEIGVDPVSSLPYHKGPTQNQIPVYTGNYNGIPISSTPAKGVFKSGDTYYHLRQMPFTTIANVGGTKTYFIESSAVSDFYQSEVSDIGRPNKLDPDYREVRRKSTIYFSELYVPETNINNLNSFYDVSFETYEQKYGSIQRLYNENHRLNAFQELKIGQIPVNQGVIYSSTGQQLTTNSGVVLNTMIYYDGEFGIGLNPESFAVFGNAKYCADASRQVPLRLSLNGLTPIAENDQRTIKMHTYFTNKLAIYNKYPNAFIYGVFDKQFKNYIMAFAAIPEAGIEGETIVWEESSNRWKATFAWVPDYMCQTNETIVSWKDGALYLHNDNPIYNNFYGVQYDSKITVPGNADPSKVKVLQAISQESPDLWTADISTESGQFTQVIDTDFSLREGMQYAEVQRDYNTPNVIDPQVNGDMIRDTSFFVTLTNKLTTFTKLFAVNLMSSPSERSNK